MDTQGSKSQATDGNETPSEDMKNDNENRSESKTDSDSGKDKGSDKGSDKVKGSDTLLATAVDPVVGKPISITSIKLCSPEEASAYIKRYNNVLEEKKAADNSAGTSPSSSPKKSSMTGNNGNDNGNFHGNNNNGNSMNNGNNEYNNERKINNDQPKAATRQAY